MNWSMVCPTNRPNASPSEIKKAPCADSASYFVLGYLVILETQPIVAVLVFKGFLIMTML